MLLGRRPELAVIEGLLEDATTGKSAAVLVRGEAGVGKTSLLNEVIARAQPITVLSARGMEAESELPFSGLHELFGPSLSFLEVIPEPQAAALRGALALGPSVPGASFAIGAATLSLLAAIAEGAVQVRRESWAAQPLAVRALTWTSYSLARFLTGVFAYGRAREFT